MNVVNQILFGILLQILPDKIERDKVAGQNPRSNCCSQYGKSYLAVRFGPIDKARNNTQVSKR